MRVKDNIYSLQHHIMSVQPVMDINLIQHERPTDRPTDRTNERKKDRETERKKTMPPTPWTRRWLSVGLTQRPFQTTLQQCMFQPRLDSPGVRSHRGVVRALPNPCGQDASVQSDGDGVQRDKRVATISGGT